MSAARLALIDCACCVWPGSWCPSAAQAGEWWQVTFPAPVSVAAVEMQGRYHGAQWGYITSYRLEYSMEASGNGFMSATVGGSISLDGPPNQRNWVSRKLTLDEPVIGRRFRIVPTAWSNYPSMRVTACFARVHAHANGNARVNMPCLCPCAW